MTSKTLLWCLCLLIKTIKLLGNVKRLGTLITAIFAMATIADGVSNFINWPRYIILNTISYALGIN